MGSLLLEWGNTAVNMLTFLHVKESEGGSCITLLIHRWNVSWTVRRQHIKPQARITYLWSTIYIMWHLSIQTCFGCIVCQLWGTLRAHYKNAFVHRKQYCRHCPRILKFIGTDALIALEQWLSIGGSLPASGPWASYVRTLSWMCD